MTPEPPVLDLAAYLGRVGLATPPTPTAAGLAALHLAHATHIPFENIDVVLGRPIRLGLDVLQEKLVRDRRGGYCFEQNLLFAGVLGAVGFPVTMLAARVRYRTTRVLPRTHMLLRVETEEGPHLADVGFGASGLLLPVPFVAGQECRQFHWTYRLTEAAGTWVLQAREPGGWVELYAFTTEPQEAVDYEVANYFVATHPSSPFTRTLTAQLPTPDARYTLRNREFTVERGADTEARHVTDDELPRLLADTYGVSVPPETRFPNRSWGE